uniref:Retrovirus-related Pol polyprotein from transposon TNT 1-94-like beta-barrel domain-containing protein n=1 Tax=Fagus sylvatica TaxID=28930 RepID=A0A2N9H9U6_FAGSY
MKEKLKKKKNHYNKNQNGNIEGYGFMLKKQITQRSTSAPTAEISNPTNDSTMPNPDLAAWTRTDRLVKAWITATISEEALGTVVGLTTSLDVWKALSNAYSQDSQAREFELLLKLQEKKKDSITLTDFIRNFKLTCDQLNAIGKSVPDQKKVFWLLNGLGPRYESFSTAMLKPPVPSYNDLIPLLHSHELRNRSLLADQVNPAMAFVGQRSNSNNKGSQSSFNSRGRGFHQAGSRPPSTPRNFQQHAPSKNSNHSSTPTSSGSIPQCQICKKKGHHALKCWHRFDHSYQDDQVPQALAALHINSPTAGEWLPDTGATAHITDDPGILSDLKPYVGSDSVMVGNGHQLPITHTGNAHIFPTDSSLSLNNVLVVPDIKKNLLSVSQLTCDYPCYFLFDNHGFVIKDLRTHQVLASGSKEDGLYVLQHAPVKVFFSNRFRVVDSDTWHGRLGHPQPRNFTVSYSQ